MASIATNLACRVAAVALTAALAVTGGATAQLAASGAVVACGAPDPYLRLSGDLDHTENLVAHRQPVRILVLASSDVPEASLQVALKRRMPGIRFEVDSVLSAGLVEDDARSLRTITAQTDPDLVVWQVGVRDALAASDVEEFGDTLDRASEWVEDAGSDLLLIDPPFVPKVRHESIYGPYIAEIEATAKAERVPLIRRYAFTRFLSERPSRGAPYVDQAPCTLDLMAEAISRSIR
ncbi:hypothetical protein [Aureimonas leprariae]|uniref:SGNH/GDSL hydrolase family protein n=1 Tax=Plantimonas leprariae TaxID=2615207 RepID=A0A7V7TYM7_9HYPH|nr:hypothetical protein [Aureimonas leprariae]KAB0677535.1 hypothetical protein F6X38_17830 [Aureimonas leprariae]